MIPSKIHTELDFIPPGVGSVQDLSPYRNPNPIRSNLLDQNASSSKEALKAFRIAEFGIGRRSALRALRQVGWMGGFEDLTDVDSEYGSIYESAGSTFALGEGTSLYGSVKHPVGCNSDRSPRWPEGFVGSISHSRRWVWAVAAGTSDMMSIGIDAEILFSLSEAQELKNMVGTDTEWSLLENAGFSFSQAVTLLFSAKEAFFKCWFPLLGEFWEFEDVEMYSVFPNENNASLGNSGGNQFALMDGRLFIRPRKLSKNVLDCLISEQALSLRYKICQPDVFTIMSGPKAIHST